MADNFFNSSTATPEQIKKAQEYAYALLAPNQEPIRHWGQGANQILQAILGKQILNNTGQGDYAQRHSDAEAQQKVLSSLTSQTNQTPQLPAIRTGSLQPQSAEPQNTEAASTNLVEQPKTGFKLDDYLKRLFEVESNNNPSATKGSYRGLGQFSKDLEKKYGINDQNWQDPTAQINAAAQHTAGNAQEFKKRFGYDPSHGQLYLMHQQGTTGGMNLMGQDPDAPAWKTIKESAGIDDNTAKQRIIQNLPAGSSISKKDVNKITNDEFTKLWTNRFESEIAPYPGKMGLGGSKPEDSAQVGPTAQPSGPQIAQAQGIPPAVSDPSANIDKDALTKMLESARIPPEQKAAIQEMMIKGATPQNRETAGGVQQFRPSNPGETSMPGGRAQSALHIHGMQIPMLNTQLPDGKTITQFMLPGGKLTDLEGVTEWGRNQGSLDTRAGHMATKYAEKETDIQNRAEGASKNRQMLSIAKALSNDPAFYSGTGANKALDYTKIASYVTGNPNWSGSTEAFSKVMAGANIAGLEAFKGYGQIRNPEIELLQQSQGNIANTPGAIQAIIAMNEKASQRLEEIGQKMREYRKEHKRVDEGFDEEMAKFYKDRPMFTDQEIKDYRKTLFGEKPNKSEHKAVPGLPGATFRRTE